MKNQLSPRINILESNVLLDGGMEFWPEGTSRTILNGTSIYSSSMFKAVNENSNISYISSQDSSNPGYGLRNSNKLTKTGAGALAASTAIMLRQDIEGFNTDRIYNNDFSLIFWVKSSVASNRSVSLTNESGSHSLVKQYNISTANVWELKVVTMPALSTCPGVLNRTTGSGVGIRWGVIAGSSQQTSALGSWVSGSYAAGLGEDTTWLTGTNHDFSIAGVMCLPGDWSALQTNPASYLFVRAGKNIQDELRHIERYYEKSYVPSNSPGSAGNYTGAEWNFSPAIIFNSSFKSVRINKKRVVPTVVIYAVISGTQNAFTNVSNSTNYPASATTVGEDSFIVNFGPGATLNSGEATAFHWTADARF